MLCGVTTKFSALDAIHSSGALLIVRLDRPEEALRVARAAIAGGFRAVEITLSVPRALEVIRELADEVGDDVVIGAGTVLDEHAAFAALQAGARLLVSPNLNPRMLEVANRYQAVSVSGALTPTEIVDSMTAGADIVKVFPTEHISPAYLKAIAAPLPQAPLLPAGGVTPENVGDWFAAGSVAVGVGSSLTKAGDDAAVTAAASRFLDAVARARA